MTLLNSIYYHSHVDLDPKTIKGIMVLLNTFLIGSLVYGLYKFFKYKMKAMDFWECLFDDDSAIILYIQVMTLVFDGFFIIFTLGKLIGSWL